MFPVSRPYWVCPCSRSVCFHCLHCLGSRLLCRELSEASPGLYALPRSKLLRFGYLGSPQRHRLSWACILCPSQVRAAQVTRCLVSMVTATYRLPHPCHSVFWGMLTFQADVDHPESQEVLAMKPACSLVDDTFLEPRSHPSGSGCPRLPVSSGGWAGPQLVSSAQSFVL